MDIEKARAHLTALQAMLLQITQRDMEQEVMGIALPVVDTVLSEVRALIPADPMLQSVRDVITPQLVEGGQVRAVDMLLVVSQMLEALPPPAAPRFDRFGDFR